MKLDWRGISIIGLAFSTMLRRAPQDLAELQIDLFIVLLWIGAVFAVKEGK